MKTIRFILLPLLLALIIALFSMTGCAGGGTGPTGTIPIQELPHGEVSPQQLQQIYSDSLMNQANLNTYKFDMVMDMITDIIGAESGKMNILTKSSGAANLASNQMQTKMEMDVKAEGLGQEDISQSLIYNIYQMTDWTYMRMEIPGAGEQWVKMPTSDEIDEQFDLVDQQLSPLESAVKLELLGYANVDGEECYVLSIVPDMEKLTELISEQQGATQDIDWGNISDLSDIFKKIEYTYYVTKDSKLPKKLVANMMMEFTPEQMGETGGSFNKMTMNISVDMTLYDHNKSFSINLPDEAQNAMEVSEDMFL